MVLDSVELYSCRDKLSEVCVDEAVVELLVETLVSSVSASKSLERASQHFLYSPSSSEFLPSRCSPRVFRHHVALIFTKGIDDQQV